MNLEWLKQQIIANQISPENVVSDRNVGDFEWIARTWKERLFELPWEPFKKEKRVYSPKAYIMRGHCIVSPKTYAAILQVDATPGS